MLWKALHKFSNTVQSVRPSIYLSNCLSVCLSVYLSIYLHVSPFSSPSIRRESVSPSIISLYRTAYVPLSCPFVLPSLCLSQSVPYSAIALLMQIDCSTGSR